MEKMTGVVLCILMAVSLSAHCAMAKGYSFGANIEKAHLSGLDGLCLDTSAYDAYHVPTHLSACDTEKVSQKFLFYNDGSIRLNDKCLVPQSNGAGVDAILTDCYPLTQEAKEWTLSPDGTVVYKQSGLVLTAIRAFPNHLVTLEKNEYSPAQSWDVTEDPSPVDVNIMSVKENKCLEGPEDGSSHTRLGVCRDYLGKKPWAVYSDGTMRPNADKSFCLTSSSTHAYSLLVLSRCEGKAEQRWNFKKDGTINNPKTSLVMDVSGWYEKQIIVNYRNSGRSQEWAII